MTRRALPSGIFGAVDGHERNQCFYKALEFVIQAILVGLGNRQGVAACPCEPATREGVCQARGLPIRQRAVPAPLFLRIW
jgi:hypothetical protein